MNAQRLPVVLFSLLIVACGPDDSEFARAFVIESEDQVIGGPKALAQPGDYLLENDQIRVAILGVRNSLGPGLYGGSIIDVDRRWPDPRTNKGHGHDQFAELFSTGNMNITMPIEAADVSVVADGSDGGAAIIRAKGEAEPFLTMLNALWVLVSQPEFYLSTDYIAEPGVPWLTIRTTAA
ncbi:MAG: PHP domain-containing protein, partial [Proteobacteria bacterium]|nr:PHP domain-containing protein [Pseudomonadota bacterium]